MLINQSLFCLLFSFLLNLFLLFFFSLGFLVEDLPVMDILPSDLVYLLLLLHVEAQFHAVALQFLGFLL